MKSKEKLKTIKNYADMKGISTTWVYGLIKKGELKTKIIDGVKFIIIK